MIQTVASMLSEALQFSFFQRALLVGCLIAFVYSQLGNFVVIRKETVISHSIANFSFLGVAIALFLTQDPTLFTIVAAMSGAMVIAWLENDNRIAKDSILTLSAQAAMALAIIVISLLEGYRIDIVQFLFGNILAISNTDIIFTSSITAIGLVLWLTGKKQLLRSSFNRDLAQIHGDKPAVTTYIYLLFLALAISAGIKTIGVILLAAFLVIPANTAKLSAKNFRAMQWHAALYSVSATVIGLFGSYVVNIPSGASIVTTLVSFFLIAKIVTSLQKN